MQTSVSMEKEPEEESEEKNTVFFLIKYTLNSARLQVGRIIWNCIIRPFIKISHRH